MDRLKQPRLEDIPTASGGVARAAFALASQAQVLLAPLLKRANLSLQQVENPHYRIAVKDQIKFLNLVAAELDDEFLGMRLAQTVDLRELGLLYYVMSSSDKLGEALRRAARYSTIHNEGVRINYRAGKFVVVTFEYFGVARKIDRHQIEFIVGILLQMCRHLSGTSLVPLRLKLMHHRSELPSEFKRLFGADVAFACDADAIVYPASIVSLPCTNADPYLNALLERYCEEALAERRKSSSTWQVKVENAIVPLLPHGHAEIGTIATELGVSRRTLARRLASEGRTFRGILNGLRSDLAKQYIREAELPLSQIAWLLGYRETSALNHAFKRWTGSTPKRGFSAGAKLSPPAH